MLDSMKGFCQWYAELSATASTASVYAGSRVPMAGDEVFWIPVAVRNLSPSSRRGERLSDDLEMEAETTKRVQGCRGSTRFAHPLSESLTVARPVERYHQIRLIAFALPSKRISAVQRTNNIHLEQRRSDTKLPKC